MSPYSVACHDMLLDDDFHPILVDKEKDIIEFLNKDKNEEVNSDDNSDTRYWN